jgi:hypothetical protein
MPGHYNQRTTTSTTENNNPVTRLFIAPRIPRYRRSDNNQLVPIGANLHEHQDGTIMTEHSMGEEDNSVTVTAVSSQETTPNRRNNLLTTSLASGRPIRRAINTNNRVTSTSYVFVDTGEPYTGRVVELGGIHYSTTTGAKEGNSREVKPGLPQNRVPSNTRRVRGGSTVGRLGQRNTRGVNNRLSPNRNIIQPSRRLQPNIGTGRLQGGINMARRRAETRRASTRRIQTTTNSMRTIRTTRRSRTRGY